MFKISYLQAEKHPADRLSHDGQARPLLKDLLYQPELRKPGSKATSHQQSLNALPQADHRVQQSQDSFKNLSSQWREIARSATSFGELPAARGIAGIGQSASIDQDRRSRAGVTSGMKMFQPSKKQVHNLDQTLVEGEIFSVQLPDFNSNSLENTDVENDVDQGMMTTNRNKFFGNSHTQDKKLIEEIE